MRRLSAVSPSIFRKLSLSPAVFEQMRPQIGPIDEEVPPLSRWSKFTELFRKEARLMTKGRIWPFMLANFLLFVCCDVFCVYTPDYNTTKLPISRNSAPVLLSILGIVNTVSVLLYGYVVDFEWVNTLLLYGVFACVSALVLLAVPWLPSYEGFCTTNVVHGIPIAASSALPYVTLAELLPTADFVSAVGILNFIEGLANLGGAPTAGNSIPFISPLTAFETEFFSQMNSYSLPVQTDSLICLR
ncbi:unnamed protein product [Soboliphyme baturini]|uniref:Autophagy-related protein n=1 Tax=Soboliphyme baturini TaxID=241478 RepID=A0A183JB40_9BILA|nr:unnamed protein product [Soboliphyme baturini]